MKRDTTSNNTSIVLLGRDCLAMKAANKLSRVLSSQAQLSGMRIAGCLWQSRKPPTTNLSPVEQKAIRDLKEGESIVIAPEVNGNATIVVDQIVYNGKIRTLLADASTCRSLLRGPTQALERLTNAPLRSFSRSGAIPGPLYEWLCSSAEKPHCCMGYERSTNLTPYPKADCFLCQFTNDLPAVKVPHLHPAWHHWLVSQPFM